MRPPAESEAAQDYLLNFDGDFELAEEFLSRYVPGDFGPEIEAEIYEAYARQDDGEDVGMPDSYWHELAFMVQHDHAWRRSVGLK